MKNVIYRIRNVVNQHYYVGSTVDSRKRFWEHRKDLRTGKHVCVRLQRAWDKYGEDCFKFEIVAQLDSREALFPAEQKWLDAHYGTEYCYNVSANATSPMRDASPEMRAKVAAGVSRYATLYGSPRAGHVHTDETKERLRQAKLDNPQQHWLGKERSAETKAKISAAQKGVPKKPGRTVSEEGKAKIRANIEAGRSHKHWTGKHHTDEARMKMSKRVVATSPDGVQTLFSSLTATLEHFGIKMPTLRRALQSETTISKGPMKGWQFRYALA